MNKIKIDDYYEPESKTSRYDEITISFKENLIDYIDKLQQENKQLKEVIEKAIEYVEGHKYTMKHYEPYGTPTGMPNYETQNIAGYRVLLEILNEVSK